MMTEAEEKEGFLMEMKNRGYSSPKAQQWDKFRKVLLASAEAKEDIKYKLKNPLILGGSIANDSEKHERLSEQLDWAISHQCFEEGMRYLKGVNLDDWNHCSLDEWDYIHAWLKGEW